MERHSTYQINQLVRLTQLGRLMEQITKQVETPPPPSPLLLLRDRLQLEQ